MAGETPITVVGNLVEDPALRFTPSGAAVCNFRVASTPRVYNRDSGQYEDGEALFLTCNVWRQPAEHAAESLGKGMRVIVNGRLKQRSYQTKEGDNRTVYEVDVDEVGPSLKFATAQVNRNPSQGGGGGNSGGWNNNQGGGGGWNNSGQQQQQSAWGNQPPQGNQQQNDAWNSAPAQGGFSGGTEDEPPF